MFIFCLCTVLSSFFIEYRFLLFSWLSNYDNEIKWPWNTNFGGILNAVYSAYIYIFKKLVLRLFTDESTKFDAHENGRKHSILEIPLLVSKACSADLPVLNFYPFMKLNKLMSTQKISFSLISTSIWFHYFCNKLIYRIRN